MLLVTLMLVILAISVMRVWSRMAALWLRVDALGGRAEVNQRLEDRVDQLVGRVTALEATLGARGEPRPASRRARPPSTAPAP